MRFEPVHGCDEPRSEQVDVEPQRSAVGVALLLVDGEQVQEQGPELAGLQTFGNESVARAVATAPRPVSEHDDGPAPVRRGEISQQGDVVGPNGDLASGGRLHSHGLPDSSRGQSMRSE